VNRREFITLLGGAAVAWPLAARAQQADKIYRIGFLANESDDTNAASGPSVRGGIARERSCRI
jgi:putative tryptophan/tyrosine transport system substrate-binding protein